MSEVLETLRQELRVHLGADHIDLPDVDADRLLNSSYWALLDKFPFREKETSTSVNTVIGQNYISVPAELEALTKLSVRDVNGKYTPLDRMTVDFFESVHVDTTIDTDNMAIPERYLRRNDQIFLYPTPDAVYPITVYYWELIADMVASQDVSALPRNWNEIILQGAVYRGYLRLQDQLRANNALQLWNNLVATSSPTEAEEETDSNRAGLRVRHGGYDW